MAQVMTHELIHAYDNCRAKVDFVNIEHLACTEVGERIYYPLAHFPIDSCCQLER